MPMPCARRAFLYLVRRKGKTASLFATVLVLATLLFCACGILQTSEQLGEAMRSSLGGALYVRPSLQVAQTDGAIEVEEAPFSITQSAIEDILSLGGFAACNPVNYGFAKSGSIDFVPGFGHSLQSNMGKVVALRSSALAPGFVDEGQVIVAGRHIAEGDVGKVLISETLAERNGLVVGDRVTLAAARLEEQDGVFIDGLSGDEPAADVEIAGVFRTKGESAPEAPTPSRAENLLYATLDVLDGLGESEPGEYTGEVDFYVRDPATLPSLARAVEEVPAIDWDAAFIRTNDFQYARAQEQLAEVFGLTRTLIVAVALAGFLILGLMFAMRMRARMREMGIALAAGVTKGSVMAQLLWETLPVSAAAVAAAWAVSWMAAGLLGQLLFADIPAPLLSDQMMAAGATEAVADGEGLRLSGGVALVLGAFQILAVAVATLVSATAILRMKPRDILTRLS